jgi:hypothetical protein
MELPKILDFLSHKKAKEQPTYQAPVENHVTNLDDEFVKHHQQIESNAAIATQQPMAEGSSVPTANTVPGNPLMVIQGATPENQLAARQIEIDATLPKDYENTKTGFGNAWDRNLLGKDGMTTPDEFLAKQAEREAAKKTIQTQAADKLKEAA